MKLVIFQGSQRWEKLNSKVSASPPQFVKLSEGRVLELAGVRQQDWDVEEDRAAPPRTRKAPLDRMWRFRPLLHVQAAAWGVAGSVASDAVGAVRQNV